MVALKEINKWTNSYSKFYLFAFARLMLGLFLFMKGVQFMGNIQGLIEIINPKQDLLISFFAAHYIALAHIAGGVLIFFGLLTRIALLVQLPILLGAVLINFITIMNVNNLFQAASILLIAIVFVIIGSGKHSLDYSYQMQV